MIAVKPLAILDRKLAKKKGNVAAVYVLVQWVNESVACATWEVYEELAARFHSFDMDAWVVITWGHVIFEEDGIDMFSLDGQRNSYMQEHDITAFPAKNTFHPFSSFTV